MEATQQLPAEDAGEKSGKTTYMVLCAAVKASHAPAVADDVEAKAIVDEHGGWHELGWHRAWNQGEAKELALQAALDAERKALVDATPEGEPVGRGALESGLHGNGLALRAIPARSWDDTVNVTDVHVPPAQLRIG